MTHDDISRAAEQAAILAAFPTRSGRHDLYAEARRLVSERHEKSELIALVNWLLHREEQARAAARADRASHDELSAEFEAFDAGVRGRMDARRSHDDLKAEALQAEVAELKAICREAVGCICGSAPVGTAGHLLERMRKAGAL